MENKNKKEIYLAGGCFWGTEKYMQEIAGVIETQVGYANGKTQAPTYQQVCRENTGHAETVRVVYDGQQAPLSWLLGLFYRIIDPTAVDQQGGDIGHQYRTGIYYTSQEDKPVIEASLAKLQEKYEKPLAIEALPLQNFYPAEEYHQKYLDKNPTGYCHVPWDAIDEVKNARP